MSYKDYFSIDPRYYAAVNAELIDSGRVKWTDFYPHETFVNLLKKTHDMLSGRDSRSLWVEGAYGVGKSHAALALKSLLEADDDAVRDYFSEYGLSNDLCQKLIADKNGGRLITVHRIGSAAIRSDRDLILAVQTGIIDALKKHGIENRGEASLKDAALKWLEEKDANRKFFNDLIREEKYMWSLGGRSVDDLIKTLRAAVEPEEVIRLMKSVLEVAEDNGITALRLDISALCDWISNVLDSNRNELSAILFVWDEFDEYFRNNQNSLTGFQMLVELGASTPFYFLIVTHESRTLIQDKNVQRKIMDRFVGGSTVRIEIPENIAFRLLAKAMKLTSDPIPREEWEQRIRPELNGNLAGVRSILTADANKKSGASLKTVLTDAELRSIVPIHPYAALILKHMSVAFNSNARSMFDFVISNDMTDAKGFKWFIDTHDPIDNINLITVDLLWDFFNGKDQVGLNDDVRSILDSFDLLPPNALNEDQTRVFKTALILEAISLRVSGVELVRPNEQNIDLAFEGTGWVKGRACIIAAELCESGFLFEKPSGGGMREYTVANKGGNRARLEELKQKLHDEIKTRDLIVNAELSEALQLPANIRARCVIQTCFAADFTLVSNKVNNELQSNRFNMIMTFARDDDEAEKLRLAINAAITRADNKLFYAESLVPMGGELFNRYVENRAYSKNYAQSDRSRATGFERQARKCLDEWRQKIKNGAFMLYTPENKSGLRAANFEALGDALQRINRQIYWCGLEQFRLTDAMFDRNSFALGAECGLKRELRLTFKSSNKNISIENALKEVWSVERYWEKPELKHLPIVRIKNEVERVIKEGFADAAGRVSILSIFEALEDAPYGFVPNNITAFVLGFVLREYADANYFWSNETNSETMSVQKMKTMIADALKQKMTPSNRYKLDCIVEMSAETRSFLRCTSKAFHISTQQCGSVEAARDQIRIRMKNLSFPIWCVKEILEEVPLNTPLDRIKNAIDDYLGIANTANFGRMTESEPANRIGALALETPSIENDLESLLTNEMCRRGMIAYLSRYHDGALRRLADEIGDGGAYLDQVKQKFNADAANWVWSIETANERIDDVILEYEIVVESNKSLPKCKSFRDAMAEWNKRAGNIRVPYSILRKSDDGLKNFLELLFCLQRSGQLSERQKREFRDELILRRDEFDRFYRDQMFYFKRAAKNFIDELNERELDGFVKSIPAGQFLKSDTEYYQYLDRALSDYKRGLKRRQLKNLWLSKTGTADPEDWSMRHNTPILCMFDDAERREARAAFSTMLAYSAADSEIDKALAYLDSANFYERLKDQTEIDRCFMARVVGDYSVLLDDADAVRKKLIGSLSEKVYDWTDNAAVRSCIKKMAENQYKLGGRAKVQSFIDRMSAEQLRRYLNELVADNLTVGMEILKNG